MTGKERAMMFVAVLTVVILASNTSRLRAAETRISIGVTETMETFNPYGDSVSLMYSVWCQVLGCLGTYDFDKGSTSGCWWSAGRSKIRKTGFFTCARTTDFTMARRSRRKTLCTRCTALETIL